MPLSKYAPSGICTIEYNEMWTIKQAEEFQDWFDKAGKKLQDDILENVKILAEIGPDLGRPHVDTLKGSNITNLKELRFKSGDKVIRISFVFDPDRNGVLLVGGDKSGVATRKFYNALIDKSENVYATYLEKRKKAIEKEQKKLEQDKKKPSKKKKQTRKKK